MKWLGVAAATVVLVASSPAQAATVDSYPPCEPDIGCVYTTPVIVHRIAYNRAPYHSMSDSYKDQIGSDFHARWKHAYLVWRRHHQGKVNPAMCDKDKPLECDWRHFVAGWQCGLPGWREMGPNSCLNGPGEPLFVKILQSPYVKFTILCAGGSAIAYRTGPAGVIWYSRTMIITQARGCGTGFGLGWIYDHAIGKGKP